MIKLLSPALEQLPDEDRKMLAAKSVNEADSSSGLNRVPRVLTALAIRDAAAASMELTNYRVPGRDRVAGVFTDRQDIVQHFLRMFDFATSSESICWVDQMVGTDRISVLVETHFQHGPFEFVGTLCFVFWFGLRSGICDIRLFMEYRAWF